MSIPQPLPWLVLGVALLLFLQAQNTSSIRFVSEIQTLHSLPLPARTTFEGTLSGVHFSGSALVFEVSNRGKITCYWRHPPLLLSLLSGEVCFIQARVEQTLRGKLCIVEKVSACGRT